MTGDKSSGEKFSRTDFQENLIAVGHRVPLSRDDVTAISIPEIELPRIPERETSNFSSNSPFDYRATSVVDRVITTRYRDRPSIDLQIYLLTREKSREVEIVEVDR